MHAVHVPSDTNKVHLVGPAQCGCRNVYAMSSAALLDEAIKQVDDLIIQLEAKAPPPSTEKTEVQPPKPAAAGPVLLSRHAIYMRLTRCCRFA